MPLDFIYVNLSELWQAALQAALGQSVTDGRNVSSRPSPLITHGGPAPIPQELHVMAAPGLSWAAFHAPTYTLLHVDERTAQALYGCSVEGLSIAESAARSNAESYELEALLWRLNELLKSRPPIYSAELPEHCLGKLTLNVSQTCNLACSYCYAGGGSYGQEQPWMSTATARMAVERVFARWPQVKTVMFFGGEPTLNPRAIQAACERIYELHAQGTISSLPRMGMVTNGLVLSQRLLDLIQRYNLQITVSLDGPPEVQHTARPTLSGASSFERVAATIYQLQAATDGRQPSRLEVVCGHSQRQAGLNLAGLADYFAQTFGIYDVYLAPVSLPADHPEALGGPLEPDGPPLQTNRLHETPDIQAWVWATLQSWLEDTPHHSPALWQVLVPLAVRQSLPRLCDGALGELVVTTNGEIYPCQVAIRSDLQMGNVDQADFSDTPNFQAVQEWALRSGKSYLQPCSTCWMRGFCRLCLGVMIIESSGLQRVPPRPCIYNQEVARLLLLGLCRIHTDPLAWARLRRTAGHLIAKTLFGHI